MRRWLWLILFLWCSQAWATWTFDQVKANTGCSNTTCAITVSSTGAGHQGFLGTFGAATYTFTSATGCSTSWTSPNLVIGTATTSFVLMAYCPSLSGSSTTITVTTSTLAGEAMFLEGHDSTTVAFDTSNTHSDTTCTSCAGAALTLTGSNDIIVTIAGCGGTCSAISGGYTYSSLLSSSGNGIGYIINTSSGTAPNWTMTSSTLAAVAIAMKESTGGTTSAPQIFVIQP